MVKFVQCEPWRIGLCGCGSSLTLYDGIQDPGQGFQLAAVADPKNDRRQLAAEKWGVPFTYAKSDEMFEKERLQVVIIATPPATHLDLILKAAEYGIHVLVQKPLTRTLREAREIINACQKHKVGLKVSFFRRYIPAFQEARRLIDALGPGLSLRISWCSSSGLKPRAEKLWKEEIHTLGGVLVDLGSHVVDVALWWMGEVQDGHLAMSIVRGDLDNIACFLLLHAGGGNTVGYLSNVEYDNSEIYEYVAKSGGFLLTRQVEGYPPGIWTLRSWKVGELNQEVKNFAPVTNPFLDEITDFVSALKRYELSIDEGDPGIRALQTTTLLYRSSSGKKDCELDDFPLEDFFRIKKRQSC
jgi:predicted dehydrogenase